MKPLSIDDTPKAKGILFEISSIMLYTTPRKNISWQIAPVTKVYIIYNRLEEYQLFYFHTTTSSISIILSRDIKSSSSSDACDNNYFLTDLI